MVAFACSTLYRLGNFMRPLFGYMTILIAALLLLPSPVSVLCIAPGHIAIEDIAAGCCASIASASSTDELEAAECGEMCTDILLAGAGQGAVPKYDSEFSPGASAQQEISAPPLPPGNPSPIVSHAPGAFCHARPPSIIALRC